jgi:NDP-sugar pyrophosphorylase family protein
MSELLAACSQAFPVVVDPQEQTKTFPAPRAYGDDGQDHIAIAASTRIALWLEHRSHLQQANLELLGATFLRSMGRPKFLLALRYLYERWRPGARRLFSEVGPGCTIHPTAIVEASCLGAGCSIGAYAIVRGSVLGDAAVIEDAAHVQMSSIGPGARVARQTSVFACVLMEGAHSAQAVMQMSVLGRHSATTSASWFIDVRLNGRVLVESEGSGLLDSGTKFLGCDMGHNSFIGAGVTVAPGRMLPSNAKIVADPGAALSKLGSVDPLDGGGALFIVKDGSLERLP